MQQTVRPSRTNETGMLANGKRGKGRAPEEENEPYVCCYRYITDGSCEVQILTRNCNLKSINNEQGEMK